LAFVTEPKTCLHEKTTRRKMH